MGYERENIARMQGYVPGEQPRSERVVKLNTNENPYAPSAGVMRAVHRVSADALRRYPSPRADQFRQTAANLHGLRPEQVIATNGGDELLRLAFMVFCEPGSNEGGAGVSEPTYSLYEVLAAIHDTPVVRVELGESFELPEDFGQRLNEAGCRLALIVNPHAPSGRLEPVEKLRKIAQTFKGVVLIDEAYVDFAERDALELVEESSGLENVLLLRSLSKGYSLAGLRFGYGLGHEGLIAALDKARDSYNTDALAQAAATAALQHRDDAKATWEKVVEQREVVRAKLIERGWSVPATQTNFVLARPGEGRLEAREIHERLREQGIFVRYFDQPGLRDKLRITIGRPEENAALVEALDALG